MLKRQSIKLIILVYKVVTNVQLTQCVCVFFIFQIERESGFGDLLIVIGNNGKQGVFDMCHRRGTLPGYFYTRQSFSRHPSEHLTCRGKLVEC